MDFNAILDFGEDNKFINTVVETPKGSYLKIEYRRDGKYFELDRVEPGIFAKPVNYGFIPRTLDEDGDELDTLILCDAAIPTGVVVKARVVGMLDFEDGGEKDHKIICVPEDDRHWGSLVNDVEDLSEVWKKQIEFHFNHYKDLKEPGTTKVHGWKNAQEAWQAIAECVKSYK